MHGGRRLGACCGLGFDTAVNQGRALGVLGGGVPLAQALVFLGKQQVVAVDARLGLLEPLGQHMKQARAEHLDVLGCQPGLVVHQVQPGLAIVRVTAQVERQRRGFVVVAHLDAVRAEAAVTQVVALLLRQALVAQVTPKRIADAAYQLGEAQGPAEVHAQGVYLNEQAQRGLGPRTSTVAHRQADHPVVALPGPGAAHMQGCQQHMGYRPLQRVGQVLHSGQQGTIETALQGMAWRGAKGQPPLSGPQQRIRQLCVAPQPVSQIALLAGRSLVGLVIFDERLVGRCRAWQYLPLLKQAVVLTQQMEQLLKAPAVEDQVMSLRHQQAALGIDVQHCHAQQRPGVEGERLLQQSLGQALRSCERRRLPAQIVHVQWHPHLGQEALAGHAILPGLRHQHHAQPVVQPNQMVQRAPQQVAVNSAIEREIAADIVEREWTLDSDQASIRQVKVLGSAGRPEETPVQEPLRHPLLQSIMRMEDPLLIQINAPVHQCNLVSRSGNRRWVICCQRLRSEGMFSLAELSLLKRLSDTLLPLVEHHAQLFLQAANRRPGGLLPDEAGSLRQVFTERLEQDAIRLSSREQEVCIGLLTGGTVPQMAQRLNVKSSSIETYLKRATAKLGVSGRHGLACWMAGT
ncbi:hypothetical protein WR25_20534 [Diploscapter pachys]|uniref:HTH luxR-type domain-containing protein n=1 Tax=Diploscapter pachys TaxID=2018661 RepID=A0A2A2KHL8_9BILA|nr:hypothetical protein WR25_20534 [Diploscapter pachys]